MLLVSPVLHTEDLDRLNAIKIYRIAHDAEVSFRHLHTVEYLRVIHSPDLVWHTDYDSNLDYPKMLPLLFVLSVIFFWFIRKVKTNSMSADLLCTDNPLNRLTLGRMVVECSSLALLHRLFQQRRSPWY